MKRFSFTIMGLFSLFAVLFFTILSCDSLGIDLNNTTTTVTTTTNNPTNPNNPTGTTTTTSTTLSASASKVLSFNRSGGKAVASLDPASDNHLYRGTTTGKAVTLAKVCENGALESLFKLSQDATVDIWPEVDFIVKSTNADEIYINFKNALFLTVNKTQTCKVGSFLCVKQDGTFVDILKKEENIWGALRTYSKTDPIIFDSNGNMYYIAFESESTLINSIYKFDPKTGTSTQITEKEEAVTYKTFSASKDGKYIFAETYMSKNNMFVANLRAIPIDSPQNFKDIYTTTSSSNQFGGFIKCFTVSNDNTVYYSGEYIGTDQLSGIFSSKSEDYTKSIRDIKSTDAFLVSSFFENGYANGKDYCKWKDKTILNESLKKEDGSLNAANVLNCFKACIPYPNLDFSIKTINQKANLQLSDDTLTNEKALLALTDDHLLLIYNTYFNGTKDSKQFLMDGFGVSSTDFGVNMYLSEQLSIASDGSIWGLTKIYPSSNLSFIRLYDSEGKPAVYAPKTLKDSNYIPIKLQMGKGYIFFSCSIPNSEYHTIQAVSLSAPDTLIDVFINVPDNKNIKISDYSISGDTLYFSGLKGGTEAISGKIDLTGQAFTYSEVASGFKINKILAY